MGQKLRAFPPFNSTKLVGLVGIYFSTVCGCEGCGRGLSTRIPRLDAHIAMAIPVRYLVQIMGLVGICTLFQLDAQGLEGWSVILVRACSISRPKTQAKRLPFARLRRLVEALPLRLCVAWVVQHRLREILS